MPQVSVIIPAYNGEAYINDSIESILEQSFSDFELIIVNDASTDSTHDIICSIKDSRIRYFCHDENRGTAEATCTGFDASSAKYVALLDQDDVAMPQRLENQVRFMNGQPRVAVCGGQMELFGAENSSVSVPLLDGEIKANLLSATRNFFNPTVMIRREFMIRKGLRWKAENKIAFDFGLFVDAMLSGAKFANLPDVLTKYRIHESQQTQVTRALYPIVSPIRLNIMKAFFPALTSDERIQLEPLLQWINPPEFQRDAVIAGLAHIPKAKAHAESVHGESRRRLNDFLDACERRWRQALDGSVTRGMAAAQGVDKAKSDDDRSQPG